MRCHRSGSDDNCNRLTKVPRNSIGKNWWVYKWLNALLIEAMKQTWITVSVLLREVIESQHAHDARYL